MEFLFIFFPRCNQFGRRDWISWGHSTKGLAAAKKKRYFKNSSCNKNKIEHEINNNNNV